MKIKKNMEEIIKVNIRKPLYGNFVYIRDSIINNAIRKKVKMEIEIPGGIGIVDPAEWRDSGKRMEKVFNFPNNPMILYGNYVPIEKKVEVAASEIDELILSQKKESKISEEVGVQLTFNFTLKK